LLVLLMMISEIERMMVEIVVNSFFIYLFNQSCYFIDGRNKSGNIED
jgi:hypothetical protein